LIKEDRIILPLKAFSPTEKYTPNFPGDRIICNCSYDFEKSASEKHIKLDNQEIRKDEQ
jgi:hypothetical protein